MADNQRIDEATGTQTVGHEWDGIEELDTPMPRWWLWTFYLTIIWSLVYVVAYPAWPLVDSATRGVLGWSSRGQLEAEMAAEQDRRAPILQQIAATDLNALPGKPELMQAAIEGGRAAFRVHCVQCHGTGAAGTAGYPNLNDDDWLWGGDMDAIHFTLVNGVRNPDHAATRMSLMPAFGRDGILTPGQVQDVVSHVRVLARQEARSASSLRGAEIYTVNCAVCHGAGGEGNRTLGAPRLSDAIWLYGGSRDALVQTVTNSRQGVMPRWGHRLDEGTIRMLTAYVHSLGGGEVSPQSGSPAAAADAITASGATEAAPAQ